MSLVNLSYVCSHLQNCSKARLGLTSIPYTNLHLRVCLALQSSGFISSVTRGGLTPPDAATLSTATPEPITTANVATRRLWLGLKYWNNEPVLRKCRLESKPTKRVYVQKEHLAEVVRGRSASGRMGVVQGLTGVGECLFLTTSRGVMEAREAVERGVGGMLLFRAE